MIDFNPECKGDFVLTLALADSLMRPGNFSSLMYFLLHSF